MKTKWLLLLLVLILAQAEPLSAKNNFARLIKGREKSVPVWSNAGKYRSLVPLSNENLSNWINHTLEKNVLFKSRAVTLGQYPGDTAIGVLEPNILDLLRKGNQGADEVARTGNRIDLVLGSPVVHTTLSGLVDHKTHKDFKVMAVVKGDEKVIPSVVNLENGYLFKEGALIVLKNGRNLQDNEVIQLDNKTTLEDAAIGYHMGTFTGDQSSGALRYDPNTKLYDMAAESLTPGMTQKRRILDLLGGH